MGTRGAGLDRFLQNAGGRLRGCVSESKLKTPRGSFLHYHADADLWAKGLFGWGGGLL